MIPEKKGLLVQLNPSKHPEVQAKKQAEMTKFLLTLSQDVASGMLVCEPHAVVVAFIGPEGPEIVWTGAPTRKELQEIPLELTDMLQDPRFKVHKEGTVQRVRRYEQEQEQKQQQYLYAHPWLCEGEKCQRRFKTARGAEIHERTCWRLAKQAVS